MGVQLNVLRMYLFVPYQALAICCMRAMSQYSRALHLRGVCVYVCVPSIECDHKTCVRMYVNSALNANTLHYAYMRTFGFTMYSSVDAVNYMKNVQTQVSQTNDCQIRLSHRLCTLGTHTKELKDKSGIEKMRSTNHFAPLELRPCILLLWTLSHLWMSVTDNCVKRLKLFTTFRPIQFFLFIRNLS